MNRREKILASLVGLLLATAVLFFGAGQYRDALRFRDQDLDNLERQVRDVSRTINMGRVAAQQLRALEQRSLPADANLARSLYGRWLREAVSDAGFRGELSVRPVSERTERTLGGLGGDVYQEQTFSVNGSCDLEQLVDFLHRFYSVDFLHRIDHATVTPSTRNGGRLLEVQLTIAALSLKTVPKTDEFVELVAGLDDGLDWQLPSIDSNTQSLVERPSQRLPKSFAEYRDTIVYRNMFSPANNPPQFDRLRPQTAERGRSFSMDVTARDPDEGQSLRYALLGEAPAGLRIDAASGRISWTPRELGDYEVEVEVTDDGLPPRSDRTTVAITVVDPPPPEPTPAPPQFDISQFAFLTAVVERAGTPQCWIDVRPEGRILTLQEGDALEVGDVTGVIKNIDVAGRQVEIELHQDGPLWVARGQSIGQARAASQGE